MTPPVTGRAIGVDGASGGWVSASHAIGTVDITFHDTFSSILTGLDNADVVVVDMPIGLSTDGNRPVDALVRDRLGPRRSTFFPTPLRSVLSFDEWADANEHAKSTSGKGLSKQAWNLVPKIIEVDSVWAPELSNRLLEGHPESSFAEMAGGPVLSKKTTAEGRTERLRLLEAEFATDVEAIIDECPKKWSADAVDALALAWTAGRVISNMALELGGDPDALGRPMRLTI